MNLEGKIHSFTKPTKLLIGFFIVTLSFGYFTGVYYINQNTHFETKGVEEHYLGNEDDENAEEMKFKKPEKDIINMIHNHVMSMSIIFVLLGVILLTTSIHPLLKKFLIIEPFISIILTFGGIWMLWKGLVWMKYVVMISGSLLTVVFTLSVILILYQLIKKQPE